MLRFIKKTLVLESDYAMCTLGKTKEVDSIASRWYSMTYVDVLCNNAKQIELQKMSGGGAA
jgi:hypothetical protein